MFLPLVRFCKKRMFVELTISRNLILMSDCDLLSNLAATKTARASSPEKGFYYDFIEVLYTLHMQWFGDVVILLKSFDACTYAYDPKLTRVAYVNTDNGVVCFISSVFNRFVLSELSLKSNSG